ncbi:MAG: inosine monophosphate cyclohydrolase, partial [Clostridia bacterium]|nr:inosine monophosphate cyclohydrolase [Clostridia bacterium]
IMGRSVNSRNRVFVPEGEEMRTKAFDESKLTDPSLIIYYPVRKIDNKLIITNGDQTDTVRDFIAEGSTFEAALNTRCFEPDEPNFTPRISAILTFENGSFTYKMSILKAADAAGSACNRYTFDLAPIAGEARFIHTYKCDGNPIPSFEGEPERIAVPAGCIDCFTKAVWNSLNEDNKVSLFVRFVDLESGEAETRIINKNN